MKWELLKNPLLMPYAGSKDAPKPEPSIFYRVLYRIGWVESFQWYVIDGAFGFKKAEQLKASMEKLSDKAVTVYPEGIVEAQGLPDTFRAHDFYRTS